MGGDEQASELKLLSIVIPARDEAECIGATIRHLRQALHKVLAR
jgi:glycosyltransferase involved in cell wall biosynthesis